MIKQEKNSYNLQDTGILVSLYGRKSLIIDVLNAVSKDHRVFLKGPSGIGKTALVIALRESIVKDYPDSICLHYECESRAHNLRSFLGSLTKQILQTKTVTLVNRESCLATMKGNVGLVAARIGAALLRDAAKKYVPGLETSIKKLYALATEGDLQTAHLKAAEDIVSQSEKEPLPVFIDILKGLSTAETKGYILLDRFVVRSCSAFSSNSFSFSLPFPRARRNYI